MDKNYTSMGMSPADGWYAVFAVDDDPGWILERIAFWSGYFYHDAEVPRELIPVCHGYVGGEYMDSAEEANNFVGYIHDSELDNGAPCQWMIDNAKKHKKTPGV